MVQPRRSPIARVLAVSTVFAFVTVMPAQAETSREKLQKAEDYFIVADFETALELVEPLLNELTGDARRDGWVLKGRCEVALGHRSSAQDSFCEALRIDAGWHADPALYTSDEVKLAERARGECAAASAPSPLPPPMSAPTPWYKKGKVLGLVGGAVAVAAVVAFSGGGDEEGRPPLAAFPDAPTN